MTDASSPPDARPTDARAGAPLGVYVHLPFCEKKCSYCHFAIDPRRPDADRQDRYLGALLAEAGAVAAGRPAADTLYLGGGTPTLVSLDRLARLLLALRSAFSFAPSAEVTVEANPSDLDEAGYRQLRALGVTRLSLGLQAFDDAVLREMGRCHDAAAGVRAYEAARRAGFADVSVDLILGWPGESRARWRGALAELSALRPDHVSLYVLEVEGRTLLAHRARRGGLSLPEDDLVADLYGETASALARIGVERYEISNFARRGRESRHNGKYWDDAPFVGLGMSAHSYRDGRRSWNVASFGAYCRRVEQGGPLAARDGERRLGAEERRAEALFTGLRRAGGVALAEFRSRYGVDPLEAYGASLRDSFRAGLLEVREGRLRLTDAGVLLSNEVFQALV